MFSDHLRKIDDAPAKTLLLVAAGLVIVCQLVAMVLVADGQVEKAHLREASQASARAATAWCVESSHGAALRECHRMSASDSARANADLGNPAPQGLTLVTLGNRY
ncbi:MAG: hypothetical protein WBK51_14235 [Polaromonas sp.]